MFVIASNSLAFFSHRISPFSLCFICFDPSSLLFYSHCLFPSSLPQRYLALSSILAFASIQCKETRDISSPNERDLFYYFAWNVWKRDLFSNILIKNIFIFDNKEHILSVPTKIILIIIIQRQVKQYVDVVSSESVWIRILLEILFFLKKSVQFSLHLKTSHFYVANNSRSACKIKRISWRMQRYLEKASHKL